MNNKKGLWLGDKFVPLSEIATRQNSPNFFQNIFAVLPDPDIILAKAGNAVETYNKMEMDPHIYAEIEKRKALTTSLQFTVERGKASEKQSQIIEDYFLSNDHELFNNLSSNKSDDEDADIGDLIEVGLDAIFHGYQPVEIIWDNVGTMKLPVKMVDRPREWFHFDPDNQLRFKSKAEPVNGELLPPYKFLLFRHKPRYNNPYGKRVLSRCFWAWMFKHSTEKWKIQFLEKFAAVWAIGKLPRGKENPEYEKLLTSLNDLINSGTGVIPDDGSIEIVDPAGKGTTSNIFDGNIKLYNDEISKAILTVSSLTSSGNSGSYASDQVRERMVKALAAADKKIPEKKISQLFKWIFDINGWGVAPYSQLLEPEDYDKERADRDQILVQQGVGFTKDYYTRKYNLEDDEFEVSKPVPPNPFSNLQFTLKHDLDHELELKEANQGQVQDQGKDELKNLVAAASPEMQSAIEPLINNLLSAFKDAVSFEDGWAKAKELLPAASTGQLENIIAKTNYLAKLKGAADASNL